MNYELHEMDCRLAMAMLMDPNSVDSIVCDPPYGLSKEPDMVEVLTHWLAGDDYTHGGSGFMGKSWDSFVPGPAVWREAYRVLKPGGHLIAFFGTRTYDLGVLALRMAGFEIRDQLAWVFGSGFPKSHDVSKGIDKSLGGEREIVGSVPIPGFARSNVSSGQQKRNVTEFPVTSNEPATPEALEWQGWGTALKPAYEPIVLCRKPLSEPTVAANVLRWGVGAINIDGCRIGTNDNLNGGAYAVAGDRVGLSGDIRSGAAAGMFRPGKTVGGDYVAPAGRWPANLTHDGSPEVLAEFPTTTSGKMKAGTLRAAQDEPGSVCYGTFGGPATETDTPGDSGSAARFFYCAKASKADRNEGLDDLPEQPTAASQFRPNHTEGAANGEDGNPYGRWSPVRNNHSTVKPSALMQWLVRLVTPPGGLVLDPFAGSGTTGVACAREGFSFVGCEMTSEYVPIIKGRVGHAYGLTVPSIAAKSARTNGGRK